MDNPDAILNLAHGWVWLVIRRVEQKGGPGQWHLQGVAPDETIAIEMCVDETYMIGPLPIGTTLPEAKIEWIGSYFPYGPKG